MGMMENMGWGSGWGSGWGMGFMSPVLTLLLVGGLIFLIFYLVNHTKGKSAHSSHSSEDRSLNILNERYARGEINDEEYERRKKMLR